MPKAILVNLVFGALLGLFYYVALSIVMAWPVLPSKLYVSSVWTAAILESAIALAATILVLGSVVSLGMKRFGELLPFAAACGFVVGATIYLAPPEWSGFGTSIGTTLLILRLSELVVGASLLAGVWWYFGRRET